MRKATTALFSVVFATVGACTSIPGNAEAQCDFDLSLGTVNIRGQTISEASPWQPVDTLYLPLTYWRDSFAVDVTLVNQGTEALSGTDVILSAAFVVGPPFTMTTPEGMTVPDEEAAIAASIRVPSGIEGRTQGGTLAPGDSVSLEIPFEIATHLPWREVGGQWNGLIVGVDFRVVAITLGQPPGGCHDRLENNQWNRVVRIMNLP